MEAIVAASYSYSTSGGSSAAVLIIVILAAYVFFAATFWRLFTKAGRPGWEGLIPIYSAYVVLKIVGRPGWWLVLYLVPIVNIVILIIVAIDLSKSFGHGGGFAVGLILLSVIFYPILAFGSSRYVGPAAASGGMAASTLPPPPPPPAP
jgi:hypothetical protein